MENIRKTMGKKVYQIYQKYREIITYVFFGGLTVLANWVIYSFFISLVAFDIWISNLIAWGGAVAFAYFTNKYFVFAKKEQPICGKELLAFLGSRLVTGSIEVLGVPMLVNCGMQADLFGVKGFFAKCIVSVVVIILNYVLSKCIVFVDK